MVDLMRSRILCAMGLLGILLVASGCPMQGTPGGSGNPLDDTSALPDPGGDGFGDITVEGVVSEGVIQVGITNELTTAEIAALIAEEGIEIPDFALSLLTIRIEIDLEYDGGITESLETDRSLEPFEIKFEVPCPNVVSMRLTLLANIPFVGEQVLLEIPDIVYTRDAETNGFECDTRIVLTIGMDEGGSVQTEVTVEDIN